MSYIGLGSRMVPAAADTTGLNPGNYTNFFSSAVLTSRVAYYEIYTMSVTGLLQVATITAYVNGNTRTTAKLFGNAEWDPSQPILMNAGDELALAWSLTASGGGPTATVWLRYDPAIQPRGI